MKLYATTTSERATKGQGGNKDLLIVITAEIRGERQEVSSLSIVNSDKGHYMFDIKMPDGQNIRQFISKKECEIKGKQQKGDN